MSDSALLSLIEMGTPDDKREARLLEPFLGSARNQSSMRESACRDSRHFTPGVEIAVLWLTSGADARVRKGVSWN